MEAHPSEDRIRCCRSHHRRRLPHCSNTDRGGNARASFCELCVLVRTRLATRWVGSRAPLRRLSLEPYGIRCGFQQLPARSLKRAAGATRSQAVDRNMKARIPRALVPHARFVFEEADVERWPTSGQIWPKPGDCWSMPGQCWSILARFSRPMLIGFGADSGPMLVDSGSCFAKLGLFRAKSGCSPAKVGRPRAKSGSNLAHSGSTLLGFGSYLADSKPHWQKVGSSCPNFGHIWPEIDRIRDGLGLVPEP